MLLLAPSKDGFIKIYVFRFPSFLSRSGNGGQRPSSLLGVFFGIGKFGAEALLSFRGVFRFAGKGGAEALAAISVCLPVLGKWGGAEAIPAFRFKFCVGMLLRQNEFIGG